MEKNKKEDIVSFNILRLSNEKAKKPAITQLSLQAQTVLLMLYKADLSVDALYFRAVVEAQYPYLQIGLDKQRIAEPCIQRMQPFKHSDAEKSFSYTIQVEMTHIDYQKS